MEIKNNTLYTTFFALPFGNYFYFVNDETKTIYQKLGEDRYYEPICGKMRYPDRWTADHEKVMALDITSTDEGLRINYFSNLDTTFDNLKVGQLFKPLDWGSEVVFIKTLHQKAIALNSTATIYQFKPNEVVRIMEVIE